MRPLQRLLLLRRVTSLCDVISTVTLRHNHGGGDDGEPNRRPASYVHGTSSVPLLGATIGQLLQDRTEQMPDKEAVVVCHQKARLTFQQLLQQVNAKLTGLC